MGWVIVIGAVLLIVALFYHGRTRPVKYIPPVRYLVTAQNRVEIRLACRLVIDNRTWDKNAIVGYISPAAPEEAVRKRSLYCDICNPGTAFSESKMSLATAKFIHTAHLANHGREKGSR